MRHKLFITAYLKSINIKGTAGKDLCIHSNNPCFIQFAFVLSVSVKYW